ncbi:hypothetical protein ACSVIA_00215 [Rhodococcus erythropolis]|uniref:hypothetical protein n=1 Tax=Rhodococcus erythropolis TaxID=1833 RepID=UPI0040438E88
MRRSVQGYVYAECVSSLMKRLDQALLLLDKHVDASGLTVKEVRYRPLFPTVRYWD